MGTDETCSVRSGCFLPLGGGFTWEPFFPILKCYASVRRQQCFPFYFIICLRLCWVFIAAWGLSLATASGGYSLVEHGLLGAWASVVAVRRRI